MKQAARELATVPLTGAEPSETLPAAERILGAARDLFCSQGIHATGIDRILAAAAASKMSLYTRFGSKEALLREVLLREGIDWRKAFFAAVTGTGGDPASQLRGVIPALAEWFNSGRFHGCAFMNATAEHAMGEALLRDLAADHHRQILAFLEERAKAAWYADPAVLARQVMLIIDGATAALMVTGDAKVLEISNLTLNAVLAQAMKVEPTKGS
jgi:AcrR family transcriptional regulator